MRFSILLLIFTSMIHLGCTSIHRNSTEKVSSDENINIHHKLSTMDLWEIDLPNDIQSITTIKVEEPAGEDQKNRMSIQGIPLPRGQYFAKQMDQMLLLDTQLTPIPLTKKILAIWPDGSIRWLELGFYPKIKANQKKVFKLAITRKPISPKINRWKKGNSLTLQETQQSISINTGPLQAVISKENAGVFNKLELNGENILNIEPHHPSGAWVKIQKNSKINHYYGHFLNQHNSPNSHNSPTSNYASHRYHRFPLEPLQVVVEHQDSMRVDLRISGSHVSKEGDPHSFFITRLTFLAGQSEIQFKHTFIFNGQGKDKILSYGFELPIASESLYYSPNHLTTSPNTFSEPLNFKFSSTQAQFRLTQSNFNTVDIQKNNQPPLKVSGQHLGNLVSSNNKIYTSIILRDLSENFPMGLSVNKNNIRISLHPENLPPINLERYAHQIDHQNGEVGDTRNRSAQGIAKTNTFYLKFSEKKKSAKKVIIETNKRAVGIDAGPLLALAPPNWYSDTEVLGIGPFVFDSEINDSTIHFRINQSLQVLQDFMRYNQRKKYHWFGRFNYGDIRGRFFGNGPTASQSWSTLGRYGWAGNSGETSNQLWVQFLRKPSPIGWLDAEAMARHTLDVQMVHYGDLTEQNLPWPERNELSSIGSLHRHGRQAWSGYAGEADYSHINGIETYYYLTGDERARDALYEAAEFIIRSPGYKKTDTIVPNGLDVVMRAAQVFHDKPETYQRLNQATKHLISQMLKGNEHPLILEEFKTKNIGSSYHLLLRMIPSLLYYHELTDDSEIKNLIESLAFEMVGEKNGDPWQLQNDPAKSSLYYHLNLLAYAIHIGSTNHIESTNHGNLTAMQNLAEHILVGQALCYSSKGSDSISLLSWKRVPKDWREWSWEWDIDPISKKNPGILWIDRQITFHNDFMQDYHSYRAFIHLATLASAVSNDSKNLVEIENRQCDPAYLKIF